MSVPEFSLEIVSFAAWNDVQMKISMRTYLKIDVFKITENQKTLKAG